MKRILCLVLVCCVMCSVCVMQGVTVFADEDVTYYLGTEIPAFREGIGYWSEEHIIHRNHVIYCYPYVTEDEYHSYRQLLETNGFNIFETKDNSEYLVNYEDSLAGTTLLYSKELFGTVAYVYISFFDKVKKMTVQVCDSEGYYDVIEPDDNESYHKGCRDALIQYRRGYYYSALESLNKYIAEEKENKSLALNESEGAFFNQLYAKVEYAIKYSDAINAWLDKIENYIDSGLYYEALAESGWLKQTYKLSPYDLAWVQLYERWAQKDLNNYLFSTGLNKAVNYYINGMYDEARDELWWIRDTPTDVQDYISTYNALVNILNGID